MNTESVVNKNSLLHAIQCVSAMSRFMEEFLATSAATSEEKETFVELIMDMDSALDNLGAVYDELRDDNAATPSSEALMDAFSGYTLTRKEST